MSEAAAVTDSEVSPDLRRKLARELHQRGLLLHLLEAGSMDHIRDPIILRRVHNTLVEFALVHGLIERGTGCEQDEEQGQATATRRWWCCGQ
jgi:hypothetical protein